MALTNIKKTKLKSDMNINPLGQAKSNEEKIAILQMMVQELGNIINNQATLIKRMSDKLGQSLFRLGKLEDQTQLTKMNTRVVRDRVQVLMHSFVELGIIDKDILSMTLSMIENKTLPVTSDGNLKSAVVLTRYNNTLPGMKVPSRSDKAAEGQ